jgi:hypothetical protein
MNRKQKIDLIRDVLLGKRSVTELLPMRYDVIRLKPDDTEEERAAKLRQIEENRSRANVTSIIVTYE